MIDGCTVLGVIVARGGSKGLPGKHLAELGGRPLLAWTIEAAKGSALIDRVILSTDDVAIASAAVELACEVPFLRPSELASDTASVIDVLRHAVASSGPSSWDYVVLLQATSPFRRAKDIDLAIRQCHIVQAPSCISLCELGKPAEWLYTRTAEGKMVSILPRDWGAVARRQDHAPIFVPNGAVYVARWEAFDAEGGFYQRDCTSIVMDRRRSVDIDTGDDLDLARCYLESAKGVLD